MITTHFALLCDYAAVLQPNKLLIAGTFDQFIIALPPGTSPSQPLPLAHCYLAVEIRASIADGSQHTVSFHLRDEDGEPVLDPIRFENITMAPKGPGRPLAAQFVTQLRHLFVPRYGDYVIEVLVDEQRVDAVDFSVSAPPDSAKDTVDPPMHPPSGE